MTSLVREIRNTVSRYVIATHSFLVAVDFDSEFRILRHFQISNSGHHYGIALTKKGETFFSKHIDEEIMELEAHPPFSCVSTIPVQTSVKYVHQIAAANGGLYLTSTDYNSLVFIGPGGRFRNEIAFGGERQDVNHINSVYPCGRQIFVLLHNHGERNSEVCVLHHDQQHGFEIRHKMRLWHTGCHNVLVDGNRLYYNASQDGAFVVVDIERQEIEKYLDLPGHVKGMSLCGSTFLVGVSEVAERDKRSTTRGRIAVIDKEELMLRQMIDVNFDSLPQPIGNINEIRCISGGERAHRRRHVTCIDWSRIHLNRRTPTQVLREFARQQIKRIKAGVRRTLRQ